MSTVKNVVVGNPICEPWQMFCNTQAEWEDTKKDTIFTNERFLPKIMVTCGIAKSINEVRKNKPNLMLVLDKPDFLEVKWGKSRLFIQVGN